MRVECDLSIPAAYFRLTGTKVHSSTEEDSELTLAKASGDLVAIRVFLDSIFDEFPRISVQDAVRYCTKDGWRLDPPHGEQKRLPTWGRDASELWSISIQLRSLEGPSRVLVWPVIVDLDAKGTIAGFELLLTGNTDGPVEIRRLCQEVIGTPPGSSSG